MESLIVPSSIQRIRSFLVELCGMKVKPWAGTEETLAALAATLEARNGCDIFWTSLRGLLESLARDLKARHEARPGTLLDNEVLDGERYATLIDEIRAALGRQDAETPTSTFRLLAAGLSAPALGLLLFLGSAATIGCARDPLTARSHDAATLVSPDTSGLPDTSGAQPETRADGATIYIQLPDTRPAQPDLGPTPDASPPRDAVTSGPDGATVTIQDIMDSCNVPIPQQEMVLACLAQMQSSWRDGIASALAGQDCGWVDLMLGCDVERGRTCAQYPGELDPAYPRVCRPTIIYFGVRFV